MENIKCVHSMCVYIGNMMCICIYTCIKKQLPVTLQRVTGTLVPAKIRTPSYHAGMQAGPGNVTATKPPNPK